MLPSRISLVFLLLMCLILVPAHASLTKIRNGAPVFIGERNLDISLRPERAFRDRIVADGADRSSEPSKTVTIIRGCNLVLS